MMSFDNQDHYNYFLLTLPVLPEISQVDLPIISKHADKGPVPSQCWLQMFLLLIVCQGNYWGGGWSGSWVAERKVLVHGRITDFNFAQPGRQRQDHAKKVFKRRGRGDISPCTATKHHQPQCLLSLPLVTILQGYPLSESGN
jgi:hypothetical protein